MSIRATTELDKQIGSLVRKRRLVVGFTQEALATRLGITFQQLQKYETGTNRIAASRLYVLAQHLETSVLNLYPAEETRHG